MAYADEPHHDVRPAHRPSPWSITGPLLLLLLGVAALAYFVGGWGHHGPANDANATPRAVTARGDLAKDEQATIDIFKSASPCVAYITTLAVARDRFTLDLREIPRGTGSGFVWDQEGHVVTNFHVIEDVARALAAGQPVAKVTLHDGNTYTARLTGVAPDYDLSVLKIDVAADKLHPIPVGTSGDLQVGQKAFAIGDPFGLDYTLTTGVVSALGREIKSVTDRPITGVIQTDAAINPGNSGGPLLDSAGRLIGVNTAIYSPSGAYAGIGFAIPVDTVNQVVPQLIAKGTASNPRAVLGVTFVPEQMARRLGVQDGMLIYKVAPDTGAAQAGLRPSTSEDDLGDVILAIDGQKVHKRSDVEGIVGKHKPGDTVTVTILRGDKQLDVPVTLQAAKSR